MYYTSIHARARRNPEPGDDAAMKVVWAVSGLAVLGAVGYAIYRATRPALGAPAPALGGVMPLPVTQTHEMPVAPVPAPEPTPSSTPTPAPPTEPSRIERARTTPAASFLTVVGREEALTPEQVANFVAAVKVIAMYEQSRNQASGRPSTDTGEFAHDIQLLQATPYGQGLILAGDRPGRLDQGTQSAIQQALATAQQALASGDWNRPWG